MTSARLLAAKAIANTQKNVVSMLEFEYDIYTTKKKYDLLVRLRKNFCFTRC